MTELTAAVRDAQADADRRFGDGPVQPWEPPPVLSDATRRRLAIIALASLLATALLVVMAVAKTSAVPAAAPAAPVRPSVDDELSEDGSDESVLPLPVPAAAPGLALARHGAEWHLSAQGAPRHEVLRRLAEASGSRLHGAPETLADARPVQLHWQGRALAPVWPLVLGHDLSYALQCRRDRCEVWILGRAGAAVSGAAAGAMVPLAQDPTSPGLPMPTPTPSDDDDDTSTHRD